ncbi:MAG TPA: amidohydrolase [Candidatus Eremiobacteraceae bacterium]|nr:amidohydrolase [Candidatus Eremiobacteraceae bacterium]
MRAAFVNADVASLHSASPRARGVLVRDGAIEALFDDLPAGLPADVRIVDCAGGALLPGFHDCHVHLTDTGLLSGGHDLHDCPDISSMLRRVHDLCSGRVYSTDPLYAGNYEEQAIAQGRPPTRAELDAVTGEVPAVLSRVDGHSCVVNSAALARFEVAALDGVERDGAGESTGRLIGAANYAAQNGVIAALSTDAKRAADERAAQMALRAGITTAHNVIVADEPFERLAEHYRHDAELPVRVISKVCSLDVRKVKRLGRRVFGGDIFVDGSIGSRTAAVSGEYRDGAGSGRLYLAGAQLRELFDEAAEHGLSLGVHAIGDRAVEEAIAAWETVIAARGALPGVRPSIDHFEIAQPDQIARAGRLGMLLSMQPAFDHLWGGHGRMYEQRLGSDVARGMNLFASAKRAGCVVCGGSDSPVTPFSALLGIHSLVNHHVVAQRLSVDEAVRAYTEDAAKLSFDEHRRGRLAAGCDADFAVLEKRLDAVAPATIKDIDVMMTVVAGEVRYCALD